MKKIISALMISSTILMSAAPAAMAAVDDHQDHTDATTAAKVGDSLNGSSFVEITDDGIITDPGTGLPEMPDNKNYTFEMMQVPDINFGKHSVKELGNKADAKGNLTVSGLFEQRFVLNDGRLTADGAAQIAAAKERALQMIADFRLRASISEDGLTYTYNDLTTGESKTIAKADVDALEKAWTDFTAPTGPEYTFTDWKLHASASVLKSVDKFTNNGEYAMNPADITPEATIGSALTINGVDVLNKDAAITTNVDKPVNYDMDASYMNSGKNIFANGLLTGTATGSEKFKAPTLTFATNNIAKGKYQGTVTYTAQNAE